MKILIWILCIFANALISTVLRQSGILLGAIPTMIFFGGTLWVARFLCKKWDCRNVNKKDNIDKGCIEKRKSDLVKVNTEKLGSTCIDEATQEERISTFLQQQAEDAINIANENRKLQSNNEDDEDFGLVPQKPIFTLAVKSVSGEKEYLEQLYTVNGDKIRYERRGSIDVCEVRGIVDIYDTYLPSGEKYKTIYINMYGARKSEGAPKGFVLKSNNIQLNPSKVDGKKSTSNRYCKKCGSEIDDKTKTCFGCGKKYFKADRFFKSWIIIGVLIVAIVTIVVLCVDRHQITANKDKWKKEVFELREENSDLRRDVRELQKEARELEEEIYDYKFVVSFVDKYAAFVEDDNTNLYHKIDCSLFKGKSFWIYNISAAEKKGYTPCALCH